MVVNLYQTEFTSSSITNFLFKIRFLSYMGNKDKGELAKMKVRPFSKVIKDFTLEDDSSIDDN